MAGPTAQTQPPTKGDLYGSNLVSYLIGESKRLNLDPAAVLADVQAEGGFAGAVGDSGTSFGPFQLHVHGRLPAQFNTNPQAAAAFANSPAGINYGLSGIAAVASGRQGTDAITQIVSRFEQPTNVPAEISAEQGYYPNAKEYVALSGGGDLGSGISSFFGGIGSGAAGAIAEVPGAVNSVLPTPSNIANAVGGVTKSVVKDVTGFTPIQIAEMVGGGLLILLGLAMVGLAATRSSPAKQAVEAGATVVAPARAVGRRTVARRASPGVTSSGAGSRTPISRQPAAVQRRAGFSADPPRPSRRKPARGRPGSSTLAKGDTIPF